MGKAGLAWRIGLGVSALLLAGGVVWVFTLPPSPRPGGAPAPDAEEAQAALAGLKPPKRARPLVAVVGASEGTELTDYLMPYGILKRAGVADVLALGTRPGPVTLYPVLRVAPDATIDEFDARHPDGADYVIVPAMAREDDPAVLRWLRAQANQGAIVIGVCVGAKVVANAGLLDGKRATTHWYVRDALLEEHPTVRAVDDRRIVVDRGVATTTGITASMPLALTLVEAIAGREKAAAVARELGLASWDARHDSAAFRFHRAFALTVLENLVAFWRREAVAIELTPGMDEVSLALVADAWSRTYRSRAVAFARSGQPQRTRSGLRVYPDDVATREAPGPVIPTRIDQPPARALEDALGALEARYGRRTADVVAMQLEYPRAPR